MRVFKTIITIAAMLFALSFYSVMVNAQPTGPTSIAVGTPERATVGGSSGELVRAQAGNMTSLSLTSTSITSRWQGYYGNVTGSITLDDANNFTLYSWTDLNPQGEIYAVNGSQTPVWDRVICFNMTDTTQNITLAELEADLGMGTNDGDGVNETFNNTFAGSFTIGSSNTIDVNDGCSAVSLNVGDVGDQATFNQTLLTDNSSLVIYTSLIESSLSGYSGAPLDFQMIVGDNGDEFEATDYYFYVELS